MMKTVSCISDPSTPVNRLKFEISYDLIGLLFWANILDCFTFPFDVSGRV